jgi:hypothetical protein
VRRKVYESPVDFGGDWVRENRKTTCRGIGGCLARTLPDFARRSMRTSEGLGRSAGRLLTVGDVAEILNVSTAWVYDHADRKQPRGTPARPRA